MTLSINTAAEAGFPVEPRCRVCRDNGLRKEVNVMLARGFSYAMIVRAMAGDGVGGAVTIDSVRNHATRHFPVQNAAQATYREILERRAAQNKIDFVEGLATAITPIAYLETIMVKAFGTLVDEDTQVGIEAGLRAAERLQRIAGDVDPGAEILRMRADVGRIIDAVKATVPQDMWADISQHLEGRDQAYVSTAAPGSGDGLRSVVEEGDDDDNDDDEPFDPVEDSDADDDF